MKIFKARMSKLIFIGLVVFGFSGNIFAAEIFASVESKAYKNYFNNQDYHKLKGEYNLDNLKSKYIVLKDYRAELFVSSHIYEIDSVRDVGEEFQFGKNNFVKLIEYIYDKDSGFEAGVYQVNNGRLIIAFGGTTSKEKYSKSSLWKDLKADLLLLSNVTTSGQVNRAIKFTQKVQADFPGKAITVTGHSLGGGLAQIASLASKNNVNYTKIKAITFNTAPVPITKITQKWIEDFDKQKIWSENNNINFMTNYDPLTLIQKFIENREKFGDSLTNTLKLPKNFTIDISYLGLKSLFITSSSNLKRLIYGKRIVLKTGTWHFMSPLLNATFNKISDYSSFQKMFVDVVENTPLYDAIFNLIKNHSISYPRQERQYKFYADENVTPKEAVIFIVNSILYDDYRSEYAINNNLTRFQFLANSSVTFKKIQNNSTVRVIDLQNIFRELFIFFTNQYIEDYRKSHLTKTLQISKIKKSLLMGADKYGIGLAQIYNLEFYPYSTVTRANIANKVFATNNSQVSNWKELANKSCEIYSNSFSENLFDGLKLVYKSLIQKAK